MSDFSASVKDKFEQQRELTKLECGLLGALLATVVLGTLPWLAIEFSLAQLITQLST